MQFPDSLSAYLFTKLMMSSVHRKWKRFTAQSKRDTVELALKMDETKRHFERKCQRVALTKWLNWAKLRKKKQAGR